MFVAPIAAIASITAAAQAAAEQRMANAIQAQKLRAINAAINPPLLLDTSPGAISYANYIKPFIDPVEYSPPAPIKTTEEAKPHYRIMGDEKFGKWGKQK